MQNDVVRLVGSQRALELFGIRLVGVNAETGKKLLFTLVFHRQGPRYRELKDAIARDILQRFDAADIQIASATFEIVGIPPLETRGSGRLAPGAR